MTTRQDLIERERSVFERMKAIGLRLVGPQQPASRRTAPTPTYLPTDTRNVPTYHSATNSPADSHILLNYMFASKEFSRGFALNEVDEWGPSDHCRIEID